MPDNSGGIGYYRYEGFSLEEKIAWMQEGPGSTALTGAQSALAELGGALIESEAALRDQVSRLGGSWEGTAGSSAGTAMMVAAAWTADSAPAADDAGTQVGLQTESVERTKYGMPGTAPRPEYTFGDAFGDAINMQTGNLFDVQTDFDQQVAQRRAADMEANRLLYQHESASRSNLTALPALGEMPSITVDSTPPPTDCLPVVPEQHTVVPPPDVREVGEERVEKDDKSEKDKTEKDEKSEKDDKPGQVEPRAENPQGPEPNEQDPQDPRDPSGQEPGGQEPSGQEPYRQPPSQNGNVSAAGFVPDPDRPQPGLSQPQSGSRGTSPGPGLGGLGGGFGGGFGGGADTSRVAARGPLGAGPVSGGAPPGRGGPAGVPARGAVGGGGLAGRGGSSLGSPVGGGTRGEGEDDAEHSDKYYRGTDDLFRVDDIPALSHSVLGEDPADQR